MVDRDARDRAARLLRGFISGKITNDAFDRGCPKTDDRAIHAIWDTAWVFYDDLHTHRLTGNYRLPSEMRRACVRWLIFLHSDDDYEWPDLRRPGIDPATRVQHGLLRNLFGWFGDTLAPDVAGSFLASGHYAVWPFISVKHYQLALRTPRLLSGRMS